MYLYVKAFHIIFMVAWFAGLFYIFRLFVYHRAQCDKEDICKLLSIMEMRLLNVITLPASIIVTLLGLLMIHLNPALISQPWLWLKFVFVGALLGYQYFSFMTYKKFKNKDFFISEKACRMINEIPTLFLIGIVLLAIRKSIF